LGVFASFVHHGSAFNKELHQVEGASLAGKNQQGLFFKVLGELNKLLLFGQLFELWKERKGGGGDGVIFRFL